MSEDVKQPTNHQSSAGDHISNRAVERELHDLVGSGQVVAFMH